MQPISLTFKYPCLSSLVVNVYMRLYLDNEDGFLVMESLVDFHKDFCFFNLVGNLKSVCEMSSPGKLEILYWFIKFTHAHKAIVCVGEKR